MTDDSSVSELLMRPDLDTPGVSVNGVPLEQTAGMGGAFEGADRLGRELMSWSPRQGSADGVLSQRDKYLLDARGHDMLRNFGMLQNAEYIYKDSIVGNQYRLNSHPNARVLGLDEVWAEEFQQEVESKFMLWADAEENWVDAARKLNFTSMIRLAIGCDFAGGEVLATAEWLRGRDRPMATCVQMIDPDRLSNPFDGMDTTTMRRGIEHDRNGAPIAAHIRMAHPRDVANVGGDAFKWKRVPFRKPWGRAQVLHFLTQRRVAQTRGIADMVAALKEMRMTRSFNDITLQNAIVNASYAAAIESELPANMAFESIGATETGANSLQTANLSLLQMIAQYSKGGRNLEIDGVKIPYLFPGTKLKMMPAGTVGGVGTTFEESLHRHISAGIGVSYEEFTHDYSKTNYSSSKASANKTRRHIMARKRETADRMANAVFALWLEEAISEGHIDAMKSIVARDPEFFYQPFHKQALCRATWIGASVGQVDEMKETQAAALRIKAGLSTYEIECARLGYDFRDVFEQRAREEKRVKTLGLSFDTAPVKQGTLSAERTDANAAPANDADDKEAAYQAGVIDQDGLDENGNKPFDDGFGD